MPTTKRPISPKANLRKTYHITHLTVLFFFIGMNLCFAEANYAQVAKFNLNIENKPLKDVFREIERISEFVIFYSDDVIDTSRKITIRAENLPITEILDKVLKGTDYPYRIEGKQIFISKSQEPQPRPQTDGVGVREIKGRVLDEYGIPMQGVAVTIKDTRMTVITDSGGNYSIKIAVGNVLVFSYMGYKSQEVTVTASQTNLNTTMEQSVLGLDEIVVIGMNNQQTKRSITGSVATIQTKVMKQSPVANLSNALAGRLPGLTTIQTSGEPGNDAAGLYIRGIGTYGNSAPLIVVDGLPRAQADFAQLDVNEIESVTILKDASSSALYGIQGANGVIVVTTKRGVVGLAPEINFTAQVAVQQPIRLPRMMTTYDQALYYRERDEHDGKPEVYTDDVMEAIRSNANPYLYPNVNWYDVILKDISTQQQYNLNLTGATGRIRYFVSGSYINQGTLFKHKSVFEDNYGVSSKFDRYNFRSNVDLDATDMLTIRVDLAGRLETRIGPALGTAYIFNDIVNRSPASQPVFNPDGTIAAGSALESPLAVNNPYGQLTQSGYYTNYANVISGTLSAKHKLDFITQGLSAQIFFSFQSDNIKQTTRSQTFDSWWYRGDNAAGNPIYQQYGIASRLATSGSAYISRDNYLDLRLNYSRKFGKHNVFAQFLANRTLKMVNDELPYAYQGLSFHVTYDFLSRYFLEFNLGYNGSENFPKGRRYGLFPAVSAGWLISDEPFMRDLKNLVMLKLRASHGVIGNDKIGGDRWLYISDYAPGGGYGFGVSPTWKGGFNENRVGNSLVTWERSSKTNIGLDIVLFRNSEIQLSVDVFREHREKILSAPGDVPDFVAITNLAYRNTGEVLNKGFEVELRLDKRWGEWRAFSTIQFSYAKNKVLQNDAPTPAMPYQDLRGYPVGFSLGYRALGLFQDQDEIDRSPVQTFSSNVIPGDIKYMDVNGDNVINEFDRIPVEVHSMPTYTGGVSLGVSWKNIDVSCLFSGAGGNRKLHFLYRGSPLHTDRWTPENTNTRIPVASTSANNTPLSDLLSQDGSYLKLRNLEIGYELPAHILNPLRIKHARIYLTGQNLMVWDRLMLKDRDPESAGQGAINYPLQRVINLGLNFKF